LQNESLRHASWQDLLASPAPSSHIVQLYESDPFLASAVALFAAEGLKRGEAVVLTGTEEHQRAVRGSLVRRDVDYDAAVRRGQLIAVDVREGAAAMLRDGDPDPVHFAAYARGLLERARGAGHFSEVRWWGEITNFLHHHGHAKAALLAEELGDAAAREEGVSVFCSFLCDRFDPQSYGELRDVCALHSHVIPAQDYVAHRLAVNQAIAETMGEIRGPLLQSLLSWKGLSCDLPSSQALLFWLRETQPDQFRAVLARAKEQQFNA